MLEASVGYGEELKRVEIGSDTITATEGSTLYLKFSEPLPEDALKGFPAHSLAGDIVTALLTKETTTLTIPEKTTSAKGSRLDREYILRFSMVPPKRVDRLSGGYLNLADRSWTFDPNAITEIVVPGEGKLEIMTTDGVRSFSLKPGVDTIEVKVGELTRQYKVRYLPPLPPKSLLSLGLYKHRVLEVDWDCVVPVAPGEQLLLRLEWPYQRDAVEKSIRESLGANLKELSWLSDRECLFAVQGKADGVLTLGLGQLTDTYGYVHGYVYSNPGTHYRVVLRDSAQVYRVNAATGRREDFAIPFSIDGAVSWDEKSQTLQLYRDYHTETMLDAVTKRQIFAYDPRTGQVVGRPSYVVAEHGRQWEGLQILKGLGFGNGGVLADIGFSPDGQKVAGLGSYPEGNIMWVHDIPTGTTTTYKLTSSSRKDPGGPAPRPIYWSQDESALLFHMDTVGELWLLDLKTGKEKMVSEAVIVSNSPFSPYFIIERDRQYYLSDFTGKLSPLPGLSGSVTVTKWLDAERILLRANDESAIYNLSTHKLQNLGKDHAFDVDSAGNIYYVKGPK